MSSGHGVRFPDTWKTRAGGRAVRAKPPPDPAYCKGARFVTGQDLLSLVCGLIMAICIPTREPTCQVGVPVEETRHQASSRPFPRYCGAERVHPSATPAAREPRVRRFYQTTRRPPILGGLVKTRGHHMTQKSFWGQEAPCASREGEDDEAEGTCVCISGGETHRGSLLGGTVPPVFLHPPHPQMAVELSPLN